MTRFTGELISFEGDDAREQREAALDILAKLENFFATKDLTKIKDKIDDKRLSNESEGLTKDEKLEALALVDDIQEFANDAERILANRRRY